jgi:hypothetical protein
VAWTTPRTWVAGETVTAALLNTHVRDNMNAIDPTVVGTGPARIGARATTAATQAIATTTVTTLTGGTSAWTASEDSGGFVSGTVGTTTPITIPAGKDGLYLCGVEIKVGVASSGRAFADLLINGGSGRRFVFTNDGQVDGSVPVPLVAGNTLGADAFTTGATTISSGCYVFCYRVGN